MFLDAGTILFYTLCVVAFIAGVWVIEFLWPSKAAALENLQVQKPTTFLLLPMLVCIGLSALSSFLLVHNNPMLIPLLMAQQAAELKGGGSVGLELEGTLSMAVLFLIGVIWWAYWRSQQLDLTGWRRRAVRGMLVLAVLATVVSSSLMVSRHALFVVLTGLAVSYVLRKAIANQLTWKLIRRSSISFVVGVFLFFCLMSGLRGDFDFAPQVNNFVGYTVASYNRLAALVQGRLHYEYGGTGVYLSTFLAFNHTLNRIFPFAEMMRVPSFLDWWASAFSSVAKAGLNSLLIYCGTFGDLFIEFGWFSPFYVFFYGLLYGVVWRQMKLGHLVGILLYPYFAFWILFWFSTNGLFDQDIVVLILDLLVLAAYEYLFVSHKVLVPVSQAK